MSSEISISARFRPTNCGIFSVSYQLLNPSTSFVVDCQYPAKTPLCVYHTVPISVTWLGHRLGQLSLCCLHLSHVYKEALELHSKSRSSVNSHTLQKLTGFVAEVSLLSVEGLSLHRNGERVSIFDCLNTARCRRKLLELKMATLFPGWREEGLMITF